MKDKVGLIIQTFTDAVVSVVETMAGVKTEPGRAFMKNAPTAKGDISGVIGMSSSNGCGRGSMSLTFTNESALGIVGRMIGEDFVEVNKDVVDAVGEMTNMVCGQGRKGMAEFGIVYSGAIPTVISGAGHTIRHVSASSVLAVPFQTEFGPVTVEICFG
ncbi:chemotaxis protein CheX [Desulfoplanes formicivorans]|uniref:Chemotaxis protein X n=1 Tax=Desulfoplanes formicivorans TaxID=1592317 RepID=A0A194AEY8_9BACT|nr:chemotaxis protein CheX [Desulfoplanes formicivorans]GAU07656.1 chemotaxis protein X [Desulfoplanes formicivorans]